MDQSKAETSSSSAKIFALTPTEEELGTLQCKSQTEGILYDSKIHFFDGNEFEAENVSLNKKILKLEVKTESSEEEMKEEKQDPESSEESNNISWDTIIQSRQNVSTIENISEMSDTTNPIKKDFNINEHLKKHCSTLTSTTDNLTEEINKEMNVTVKVDLISSVKRDYSRSKKKDEKGNKRIVHFVYL